MATQTLEFNATPGLTITLKLYTLGTDTEVDTASATERTNDKGRYTAAFTDLAAATYRANGFVSTDGGFANEVYVTTAATATFYPASELDREWADGERLDALLDAVKVITDALGATAATRLSLSAGQIVPFTIDTVTNTHTPTVTEFQADDITEATADHYNGRIVIFTSGALAGQATSISDYAAVGGIGQFTVLGMTEAPANNDTGIIV